MIIALGNVPFSSSDLHRYANITAHFSPPLNFSDCRMIKDTELIINSVSTGGNIYDAVCSYGYGYYAQTNSSKKYYFFVDNYNYINDCSVSINISVDWFSTDFSTIEFTKSYVNQMHPADSSTFDFLPTAEPYGFNDKKYNAIDSCQLSFPSNYAIILGVTHWIPHNELLDAYQIFDNPFHYVSTCTYTAGNLNGLVYYYLTDNSVDGSAISQASTVLQNAVNYGYSSSITGLWVVPQTIDGQQIFSTTTGVGSFKRFINETSPTILNVPILANTDRLNYRVSKTVSRPTTINGYTPVYAKCFGGDFFNFAIKTDSGMCEYNPLISGLTPYSDFTVNFYANNSPNLQITAVPYFYMYPVDIMNSMSINVSASGSLTADNTTREIRDFVGNIVNSAVGGLGSAAISAVSGGGSLSNMAVSFGQSAMKSSVDILGKNATSAIELSQKIGKSCATITGANNSAYNMFVGGCNGFSIGYNAITYDDIHNIDKMFSKFGYTMDTLITPVLRNSYSYIRGDINFISTGSINNISREYIKQLFNAGLTIWNMQAIYNYDVV